MDNEALILDLLEWLAVKPRRYDEVMSAWRTSCPRLTIWEDAVDAGFLRRAGAQVRLTPQGQEFLRAHARAVPHPDPLREP